MGELEDERGGHDWGEPRRWWWRGGGGKEGRRSFGRSAREERRADESVVVVEGRPSRRGEEDLDLRFLVESLSKNL